MVEGHDVWRSASAAPVTLTEKREMKNDDDFIDYIGARPL